MSGFLQFAARRRSVKLSRAEMLNKAALPAVRKN
jgi:hypothetical protein